MPTVAFQFPLLATRALRLRRSSFTPSSIIFIARKIVRTRTSPSHARRNLQTCGCVDDSSLFVITVDENTSKNNRKKWWEWVRQQEGEWQFWVWFRWCELQHVVGFLHHRYSLQQESTLFVELNQTWYPHIPFSSASCFVFRCVNIVDVIENLIVHFDARTIWFVAEKMEVNSTSATLRALHCIHVESWWNADPNRLHHFNLPSCDRWKLARLGFRYSQSTVIPISVGDFATFIGSWHRQRNKIVRMPKTQSCN